MSYALLATMIGADFMGGMSTRQRLDIHDEMMRDLRAMGLKESQLQDADRGWRQGMNVLFGRLFGELFDEKAAAKGITGSDRNKLATEINSFVRIAEWQIAPVSDYRDFFKRADTYDAVIEGWFEEFEHFKATGELRCREDFLELVSERQRRRL
jgi:hypothetical protein